MKSVANMDQKEKHQDLSKRVKLEHNGKFVTSYKAEGFVFDDLCMLLLDAGISVLFPGHQVP